jgi:hypothetical protein
MTVLELTRLLNAQDDRWAGILTYAQSTRDPGAPAALGFFRRTWRPLLGDYLERVAGRIAPEDRVPAAIMSALLDKMSEEIYPAARRVGLRDDTFLVPDIAIEHPIERPIERSRGGAVGAEVPAAPGARMDWKGWGILTGVFGIGYLLVAGAKQHYEDLMRESYRPHAGHRK